MGEQECMEGGQVPSPALPQPAGPAAAEADVPGVSLVPVPPRQMVLCLRHWFLTIWVAFRNSY